MTLTLRFTRLSDDLHRFEYTRADGTSETMALESQSFLVHDLWHYAVESEAALRGSFYGLLDRIGGYAEISVNAGGFGGEAQLTEMIVGLLTQPVTFGETAEVFVERGRSSFEDMNLISPRWFTPVFVEAVRERMRQLQGEWEATPFGDTMTLTFEPAR